MGVVGEAAGLGLLGLSGWFIASCSLAGVTLGSGFSYLVPSGGVRALALTRIGADYGARVALHGAAQTRVTLTRMDLYDAVARGAAAEPDRAGVVLDRALADADQAGESLLRCTAPLVTWALCSLTACVVVARLAPLSGTALAATSMALLLAGRGARGVDHHRGEVRSAATAEVVTAVEAWPEMRALGAVSVLRQRTSRLLRAERAVLDNAEARLSRRLVVGHVVVGLAMAVVTGASIVADVSVPDLVLIMLLATGVLQLGVRLPVVLSARDRGAAAASRLRATERTAAAPVSRVVEPGALCLSVSDYHVPASVHAPAHCFSATVRGGRTLTVYGPSGSGKSTLLASIAWPAMDRAGAVKLQAPKVDPRVVLVSDQEYLFTGTITENLRLGDPNATEEAVVELLNAFGLAESGVCSATRTGPGERPLSGGEERRVHLARAILARPDVLLVDEPDAGLDPSTARSVTALLRRLLPEAVLVYAAHSPRSAADDLSIGL